MPTQSNFDETVDTVCEMVNQLDVEKIIPHEFEEEGIPPGEREEEGENSKDKSAYTPHQYVINVITSIGPNYVIRAVEDEPYFDIIADFSLIDEIEQYYEEESYDIVDIETLPDDHPIYLHTNEQRLEESDEDRLSRRVAAIDAIESLGDEVKGEIIYQLTEIFTNASVKHIIESTRNNGKGGIAGFQVYYRIFPYEDEFCFRELNDVVERVRMATQRGQVFLKYSFQLDIDFGETTGGKEISPSLPNKRSQSPIWDIPDK